VSNVFLSHVGIAVKDLDEAVKRYAELLGFDASLVETITEEKVRVAMFTGSGGEHAGGCIELVMPFDSDSPVSKFLDRRGEGVHHIAVYVDDLEARLRELKASGVRLIDETPRVGVDGCRFAFVHPGAAGGVLLELEERPRDRRSQTADF
jgi:methylmalonyl-CoA/ethylmalonyl-CoA epimerase